MKQLQNPLLKGFYPDPSICRVFPIFRECLFSTAVICVAGSRSGMY